MKNLPSVFLFILIVFASSCDSQPDSATEEKIISIRKSDLPKPSMLSEFVESVRIVPLETNPDCLISYIFQMEQHEDELYISLMFSDKGVLVFNSNGKYLRTIGQKGKGPGEFAELQSFSMLAEHNLIYLNDRMQSKTIEFDLEGNFIREISHRSGLADLIFLKPDLYYLHYPSDYYLTRIDAIAQDTVKLIPHKNGYYGFGKAMDLQANGEYYYSPTHHDSIYLLREDTIQLKYAFDFGQHQFSGEDFMAEIAKTGRPSYPPNRLFPAGPYVDFPNFLHFRLFIEDPDKRYTIEPFLWAEESNTLFMLNDNSDDILFCSSHDLLGTNKENEWISSLSALELIESKERIKINSEFNYPKELFQQIDELKENDNPVLVFMKLKHSFTQ